MSELDTIAVLVEWSEKRRDTEMWNLFHNLWSRDVGRDGYDKEKWKRLEAEILKIVKQRNDLEDFDPTKNSDANCPTCGLRLRDTTDV